MPRGKKNLLETTNLPIIKTNTEEGKIPYFIIDNEWGIACDDRNEILVHKNPANKTIKNDQGEDDHIEQYYMWTIDCYPSNVTNALEIYADRKGKEAKSKLLRSKDYNDLLRINRDIQQTIDKALDSEGVNQSYLAVTSILDERSKLEEELNRLRELTNIVEDKSNHLLELIKEKQTIIISETKPHNVKKKEK